MLHHTCYIGDVVRIRDMVKRADEAVTDTTTAVQVGVGLAVVALVVGLVALVVAVRR